MPDGVEGRRARGCLRRHPRGRARGRPGAAKAREKAELKRPCKEGPRRTYCAPPRPESGDAGVAQTVRAGVSYALGQGFDSLLRHHKTRRIDGGVAEAILDGLPRCASGRRMAPQKRPPWSGTRPLSSTPRPSSSAFRRESSVPGTRSSGRRPFASPHRSGGSRPGPPSCVPVPFARDNRPRTSNPATRSSEPGRKAEAPRRLTSAIGRKSRIPVPRTRVQGRGTRIQGRFARDEGRLARGTRARATIGIGHFGASSPNQ